MRIFFCLSILMAFFTKAFSVDSDSLNIKKDTIWTVGVGDIMLGTDFPEKAYLPPGNNCFPLMESLFPILQSGNITFGNLEGVFLDEGKVVKRCKDTTKCYAFKMPEKYASCLDSAGFDLLSLANNHFNDFGWAGKNQSMKILDSLNIDYAGLVSCPYTIIERKNLKIGFAAFAPNKGTVSINNHAYAKRIVKDLNAKCDIVIVSFHGGAEGSKHESVPKATETFYGENRGDVYKFSHELIDVGADIVLGHGPHVTRAFEVYKERIIFYSLGNFCTYGRFNLRGPNGIAPIVKIGTCPEGKLLKAQIIPVKQIGGGGVNHDSEGKVIKRMNQLVKQDFPNSAYFINSEGIIVKSKI